MSTPVGHTLFGWIIGSHRKHSGTRSTFFLFLAVFVFSNLPDMDLLFGLPSGNPNQYHHMWTHSIGFALLWGVLAGLVVRILNHQHSLKIGFFVFLLILSHLTLDFFTLDKSAPYGMQLFWPVTEQYFLSPVTIFRDVYKASDSQLFLSSLFCLHNVYTILFEIVILLPVYICIQLVRWIRGPRNNQLA